MTSENRTPPKTPTPQSIPLQDLSRPPDTAAGTRRAYVEEAGESSTAQLGSRRSILRHNRHGSRYQRLAENSPTRLGGTHSVGGDLDVPRISIQRDEIHAEPVSPLDDVGEFATAMGGLGLSFDRPRAVSSPSTPPHQMMRMPRIVTTSSQEDVSLNNGDIFSPEENDDTTPLAGRDYLYPARKSTGSTPQGQRHDRQGKRTSVHFQADESPGRSPGPSTSRLGDDLPTLETGLGVRRKTSTNSGISRMTSVSGDGSSRERSLSPSPMARANSMLRAMSQRVVNLSNDSDMVEQTIRRKSTVRRRRSRSPSATPNPVRPEEEAGIDKDDSGSGETLPDKVTPAVEEVHVSLPRLPQRPVIYPNPLRGKSWGIFGPDNRLRRFLCEVLVHPATEPIILVLIVIQAVLLAVKSAPTAAYNDPRAVGWSSSAINWALLALFVVYTIEVMARTIVSGFVSNPREHSTIDRSKGLKKAILSYGSGFFALNKRPSVRRSSIDPPVQPSIVRTFTGLPDTDANSPGHSRQQQRMRLARRAFLRHSFNRLDFVAVVAYWISFGLAISGYEPVHHVYVFDMLSCLRILRLLGLTSGTSIILRSLKRAAPLLVNVAFLISFFWLLFAIVGVQSFKSSLRRTCVYFIPDGSGTNYTQNQAPENIQFCGGHLDNVTGLPVPWVTSNFLTTASSHKGFLCPRGSLCIEGVNPYNGTVSFDNIGQSLELVFVVISNNTFTDLMYYLTNSDYLAAALFFAAAIVVMTFWLINLLIAVITSSFQVIREESKQSAFTAEDIGGPDVEDLDNHKTSRLKRTFDSTYWFWIAVIVAGLVVQSLRSANMSSGRVAFLMNFETTVTFLLAFEITIRIATDRFHFFRGKRNCVDLALVIVTLITQLPPIRNRYSVYAWLTFFQVARIYRVVMAFAVTRDLIMVVFSNIVGLLNLIVFVLLLTFLGAILASRLFRGDFAPADNAGTITHVTFGTIYNSFLGMYQILSSENWTNIMYNATQFDMEYSTAWLGAMFCIMWFIFANTIVLNMFIAVIQESFDVSEDEKRLQQVKAFLRQKELGGVSQSNLSLSSILKFGRNTGQHRDALDYGPAAMEQLLKDAVVKDFLDEPPIHPVKRASTMPLQMDYPVASVPVGFLSQTWDKITGLSQQRDPNPFYSQLSFSRANEDFDPKAAAKQVYTATEQRKKSQRQYLLRHPKYNVSLFIFKPGNPIRRFCQYLVGSGRGEERIEGVAPNKAAWYIFSALIYAAIVAMVLLACITTPLYQREYYQTHSLSVRNWFVWTDMSFAVVFTIEAIIKVIADGFFFTPHAYFHSVWGFIDGVVLVTLWINVITSLYRDDGISRAVGAFKALRALRLLNVSDSARNTFHSVIILGGWKVVSAAFVSMSLLIPFAILGLNLFNGQMEICNDSGFGAGNLTNCVGEWNSTPFSNEWNVLAPRRVANPYYSFDNFGSSLFILFQIVSQEGWIDVMWSAMSATGKGLQPQAFATQGNGVFFVVFNLLGSIFILTLFVSVFMRNYTEQTGVAFLTAEQRSWLELRKLLKQISPSKRSLKANSRGWQRWCYRLSVQKHGKWQQLITGLLVLHLALLCVEVYPSVAIWDRTREFLFFLLTLFYIANVIIRVIGLSWKRFRHSSWDVFSVFAVTGAFVTTIMTLSKNSNTTFDQIQKLCLVSIVFLLIPRNNQLDQLFKTAAASLEAIGNLLATWFVLFLVYAIAFTQAFGLTRFGSQETGNLNFRNVPKALILLFRMSCGEGWNQIMEDYAGVLPPYCTEANSFFNSDCGSDGWARGLFISWNIISMYIFVSLFVSLIFESFSYVYQRSNGLAVVTREEIRRFKEAWSLYDRSGTGYISKEAFPRLLGELSGVFSMRIYEEHLTVRALIEDCSIQVGDPMGANRRTVAGIDLDKLNEQLSTIPVKQIRERRARLNVFYQEMLVSADPDRGISFNSCLMILCHYKVINDTKSLRLEEFLRRRARLQRVHETIRRNTVISFFDTLYWYRQFRRIQDGKRDSRMAGPPQINVPEIFVENPDDSLDSSVEPTDFTETTPLTPRFRSSTSASGSSPGRTRPRIDTSPTILQQEDSRRSAWSPGADISPGASPRLSPTRLSAVDTSYQGALRVGTTTPRRPSHSRANSSVSDVSAEGVMEGFENSAWGESLRRSFTMRRPSRS